MTAPEVTPPRVTSRFRKGTTTFGPVGRICWTIGIVGVPIFCGSFGGVGGIVFVVLWCTTVAPMALKDIWQADSPTLPAPPSSPGPAVRSYDGTLLPTLSEYVASQGPPAPPTAPPTAPPGLAGRPAEAMS